MIFLTITGSFTGAYIYDRREKRRVQQKWSDHVAHLSRASLPIDQTRRRVTIFLSAPPGDGLSVARSHFREYVKPVLVAAALDYIVIEGVKQGDLRAKLAERIRKLRRNAGEPSAAVDEQVVVEDVIADAREKIGVYEEPGPKGDIVIGRHTWKEYIRGLHEGWLGPLDPLPQPAPETPEPSPSASPEEAEATKPDDGSSSAESTDENTPEKKVEKPKPSGPTPAYLASTDYSSQNLPPTLPQSFDSSIPIAFPHILGFLNTPIRIYRFLNQRHLAEDVGREVAGLVLASSARPYQDGSFSSDSGLSGASTESSVSPDSDTYMSLPSKNYEQQSILEHEEKDWHKSVHKRNESDKDKEREWLDDIILDPRIAGRMKRATLSAEEDERAKRIGEGKEYILGEERPPHVSYWKRMWIKYGYGEDEETLKNKPIIGNIDGEDGL